jgi:DNA polymerase-3 subunit beta
MKLTVSRTELFNKLSAVGKVINPKTPMPVAENFLFNIEKSKITITATDLETTLTSVLSLEHETGEMILAVPPKLIEVLKEMPEQLIHFNIDESSFKIDITNESGNYKGDFLGINVGKEGEEFPKPRELSEENQSFELASEVLFNGIYKTSFATAEEDSRPTMTGILFDIFPENITFVATDAHKLVKYNASGISNGFEGSFILPKKPAQTLKNILVKSDDRIKISFDEKNIVFELPDFMMKCRRIEGRYPNYNTVIQQNNPFKMIVDRALLLSAVKRVKVFSNEGTGLIKLNITENNLNISAQDIDFSTSAEETLVCQYGDDALEISFKAKLLEEILSNISSSEVVFELTDATKPGIIVPLQNEEKEELLMLLMPMFLN